MPQSQPPQSQLEQIAGNPQDLDKSIALHRRALVLFPPPHPNFSTSVINLALSLGIRFEQRGNVGDLDESILFHRKALELFPPPNPVGLIFLLSLGFSLWNRFERQGAAADLDESISNNKRGLELTPSSHPQRPDFLHNLGIALQSRFNQRGDVQDLEKSISLVTQALKLLTPPDPRRSAYLNDLACTLWTRFGHRGDAQDLDQSISFHREALKLRATAHPERASSLNGLGCALWTRYQHQGDVHDLDESISLHRRALELTPPPHPGRGTGVINLGVALWFRSLSRVDARGLDESISFLREAVNLLPSPHPTRPRALSNLALALSKRFQQQRVAQDLDESISLHRQALQLFPISQPNRCGSLNNIALAVMARFEERGNAQDLDEAISFQRQALELRPPPHPRRSSSLNNLAFALSVRFERQGDSHDCDEAISFYKASLELTPPRHPLRSLIAEGLAKLLMVQYKQKGDNSSLEQAMVLFSQATHSISQSSSGQFRRARSWALQADLNQHPSAIEAFDIAIGVLPGLAALGLDVQSRQDSLITETDGLAREAAGCAIRMRNLDKAVEFLETGRSVFWSQFLTLRSPFDRLHDVAPELATNLRKISKELETASHRNKSIEDMTNRQKISWEQEARRFEQLADEWKQAVNQVRGLRGFEDFLQPQSLAKLQTAAKGGPIVYLIANNDTSNCLVISSTHVHHIPLPTLTNSVLSILVKWVQAAVSEDQISRIVLQEMGELRNCFLQSVIADHCEEEERGTRLKKPIPGYLSSDRIFRAVLRMLWDEAVKPVMNFLELKKSTNPGRPTLTWCTTGLFTLLPVHAAGNYYEENLVDCASDYIISSYSPTIGALLISGPPPLDLFKMMVVIQSQTLPSTRKELEKIEQHVPADSFIKFGTREARASVEEVASRLSAASIVHFACHGKQDSTNPLQSGLDIEGKLLTISRIMKESMPNGSLAFLSACETSMGDKKIPDEAMSMAASLLFTGFRRVVATMWKMWDEDGPVVADTFYRELFKGPDGNPVRLPDTTKSAEALAMAVNELRIRGVPYKRWVPFIHMG